MAKVSLMRHELKNKDENFNSSQCLLVVLLLSLLGLTKRAKKGENLIHSKLRHSKKAG